MTAEEALEVIQRVLDKESLNKIQDIVFRECWERRSYQEIATSYGYEVGYIRDVGYKLWNLLSNKFGNKINKNKLHLVLKQHDIMMCKAEQTSSTSIDEWQRAQKIVPNLLTVQRNQDNQRQDWGDAVDVSSFYGRAVELTTLKQWIIHDRCRLIALLGMVGIGKTTLAMSIAEQLQDEFEYVFWRSLRNALPIEDFLTDIILFLFERQELDIPKTLEDQMSYLIKFLRQHRCLLVLDNIESIFCSNELAGRYRSGYELYGQLLRRLGDEHHQSCVILTSREKPVGFKAKEGKTLPVRSLYLSNLQLEAAQEILKVKGLVDTEDEIRKLVEYCAGNPLALKISATTIQDLFDGNINRFLEQGTVVFGDIWEVLDRQFNRLSTLEKQIMCLLASDRKQLTLAELQEYIVPIVPYRNLLEALESLQQRSVIKRNLTSFTQHPMITDYINEQQLFKAKTGAGDEIAEIVEYNMQLLQGREE
ncbi:NB-ARC domain-containing protein [Chlorogloea sp. CCALA 695]|uniref:NB-ARC domain-containing protein n=1 Tax=Chlorogloea sp. CCALA 695 TaxID=2107693 RepID=UPI000D057653|nr:NB-ARC domain-containing protein [Chlorogloea sp. CCALA 695]PSB29492.1 hypothetical protein C7B70_18350 [Chlorogloea sp. CCALA 695]